MWGKRFEDKSLVKETPPPFKLVASGKITRISFDEDDNVFYVALIGQEEVIVVDIDEADGELDETKDLLRLYGVLNMSKPGDIVEFFVKSDSQEDETIVRVMNRTMFSEN